MHGYLLIVADITDKCMAICKTDVRFRSKFPVCPRRRFPHRVFILSFAYMRNSVSLQL